MEPVTDSSTVTVVPPPQSSVPTLDFQLLVRQASTYLRPEDLGRVEAAYHFAAAAHKGQFRISGDAYISHPVAVATICAGWHLDAQALIAALLHDVVEDTAISKQEISERFGRTAAELVDGLSKLDKIEFRSQAEAQAENFRKMLLAMASDLRVILIKLADRLHNVGTLGCVRADKRRRIARETLEIYAPLANRLGLNTLYRELQDLSFSQLYPTRYRVLLKSINSSRGKRHEIVGKTLQAVRDRLHQWGIEAEISGREKHIYGIYRKMVEKHLSFSQVLDIYGLRIVVKDVPNCYVALGALHGLFKPVPGKFKDYIAIPKANGYQSVHTTLIGPFGTPIEVQVRTQQMHHVAETGVASHWLYKDDNRTLSDLQQRTHTWLQSLLDLQSTTGDSTEFLEHVKIDLFPGEVFVFTPKGKIFTLPRGATPVDLAYAVHTDIGHRCVACRINHELAPLRTELNNGDLVEIVTAPHASPNPAWLSYARSARARAKIRHFLRNAEQEESAELGERLLGQALRPYGLMLGQVSTYAWDRLLREAGLRMRKELLTDIGLGKRLPIIMARRLAEIQDAEQGRPDVIKPKPTGAILIRGTEGVAVQLARCCRPIPGDPIVGIIRKGQGLEIHLHDCPAIGKPRHERERWIDVEWEGDIQRSFDVSIRVVTQNTPGVLAKVAAAIAEADSNIQNIHMDGERGVYTTLHFTLQVRNRMHLATLIRGVRRIPEVVRVSRNKAEVNKDEAKS
jgi:guanosine-3',5'-bis(diphosphate) 3'-pyrophosphohydrolase